MAPRVQRAEGELPKARGGFTSVSVPVALLERLQSLMEKYPMMGYGNKSAFVVDALRRRIEEEERHLLGAARLHSDNATERPPPFDRPWPPRTGKRQA